MNSRAKKPLHNKETESNKLKEIALHFAERRKPPRHIALITDFGLRDAYVAAMKGVILSINPYAEIVDVTHGISQGDVGDAAFLLYKTYSFFPEKTIFLVVVDPGVGSRRKVLLVKTAHYFFVGPDNGVLSLAVCEDRIHEIIDVTNKDFFLMGRVSPTFHGRDIFAPVSAYLSKDTFLRKFGKPLTHINRIGLPKSRMTKDTLTGQIIYIDTFGNLIINIKKTTLVQFLKKKPFMATLNNKTIKAFYSFYLMAERNEPFLVEGGFSLLEVSLKDASAKNFFKAEKGAEIIIKKLNK